MDLNYNKLPILQGDYLDYIKKAILKTNDIRDTSFHKDKHIILSKILFLAWQKGLSKNELYDILDYIPTNDKVLKLVYEYKGICSRSILLQSLSIVWTVNSIETKENEVVVLVKKSFKEQEQVIFKSQLDENEKEIPLIYNDIPLISLVLGNQTTIYLLSFIKLFLPVGVYLNVSYL